MAVVVVEEKQRHNGTWEALLSEDGERYTVVVSEAVHDGDAKLAHYQAIVNQRRKVTATARERAQLIAD